MPDQTADELKRHLREEADRIVEYLRKALESAPGDPSLRAQLEAIISQAEKLQETVHLAVNNIDRRRLH